MMLWQSGMETHGKLVSHFSLSGGKGYLFVILQPFFFFFFLRAAVAVIGLQILATFPNISQTLVAKVNKVLSTIVRRLAQLTVWQTYSEKLVRVEGYFFTTDEGLSLCHSKCHIYILYTGVCFYYFLLLLFLATGV